jgi:quinol monooxygenase YgiN
MITIIGHVKVRPDRTGEFEKLYLDYAARVKANEPGVLVYQLNRSRTELGAYAVIEIYRDQAALDAHRAAAYFQAAIAAIGACVEGAAQPEYLDAVE